MGIPEVAIKAHCMVPDKQRGPPESAMLPKMLALRTGQQNSIAPHLDAHLHSTPLPTARSFPMVLFDFLQEASIDTVVADVAMRPFKPIEAVLRVKDLGRHGQGLLGNVAMQALAGIFARSLACQRH
jgi:hypothetical protein